MGFTLRPNLFFCISNNQVALLDLAQDRYFALSPRLDAAFQGLASASTSAAKDISSISELVDKRILVELPSEGFLASPAQIPTPTLSLVDTIQVSIRVRLIAEAVFWQVDSALRLRDGGLHAIISDLRREVARSDSAHVPLATLPALLPSFLISRRLVPTQERCLRWSIAMARYLHRHGVRASLVIGVATKPFRAHAWVQDGGIVYSDRLDTVLRYTPIFVV